MKIISKTRSQAEKSQTLLEFAIIFPLFLFALFGLIDFSNFIFQKQTVSQAVREGGRIATTGRILFTNEYEFTNGPWITTSSGTVVADPGNPTRPMSREQAILFVMMKSIVGMKELRTAIGNAATNSGSFGPNFIVESWPGTNGASESSPNLGPGERSNDDVVQYVRISLTYPASLLTPVNTFSKFFGSGDLFNSNKFNISYRCTFVNEAWSYNNTNQW